MAILPSSTTRVPEHTSDRINEEIKNATRNSLRRFAYQSPAAIDARLAELDREWDIERALEANAAAVGLLGVGLSILVNRKWLLLSAFSAGFLFQHSLQGWCPPLPFLRRLGFRTPQEIDEERYALKAMRGDFENVGKAGREKVDVDDVFARVLH